MTSQEISLPIKAWASRAGAYLLDSLLPAVLLLAVGILTIRVIMGIVTRMLEKTRLERAAHSLIKSVIRVALYFILVMVLAGHLGIDMTSVIALASVLTLAISLAVQNVLSNVIGGFTLLATKPFATGDLVEIGGQLGTVTEIGLNYTKLSTPDNKNVCLPNSGVTAGQIVNYTALGKRRVDISVGVSYDMAVEDVLGALLQAGSTPTTLESPAPFAGVRSYGENAVEYVLQVWARAEDYWTTYYAIHNSIQAIFQQRHIEFTYPHIQVHMEK